MTTQTILLFVFGITALIARVFLAVRFPDPTPDQQVVFRTVLALSAAGIAAIVPGMFDLKSHLASLTLSATGTIAVFAFVYLFNPPKVPRTRVPASPALKEKRASPPASPQLEPLLQRIQDLEAQVAEAPQPESITPPAPFLSIAAAWLLTILIVLTAAFYFTTVFFHWPLATTYQAHVLRLTFAILASAFGIILPSTLSLSSSGLQWILRICIPVFLFILVYFLVPV